MNKLDITKPPKADIGRVLIEASAGTGKTYSISKLFLHNILDGIEVDKVLVVTFTVAATGELRTRLRQELNEAHLHLSKNKPLREQELNCEDDTLKILKILQQYPPESSLQRLSQALRNFDQAAIVTIHGFAQRILGERAFESGQGFELELVDRNSDMLEDIRMDFLRQNTYKSDDASELLEALMPKSDFFDKLADLAKMKVDFQLHPQPATDLGQALLALKSFFQWAKDLCHRLEDTQLLSELYGTLYDSNLISKRSYKPGVWKKDVDKWKGQLRDLADETQLFQAKKILSSVRFKGSAINQKLNDKAIEQGARIEHPVFEEMDRLEAQMGAAIDSAQTTIYKHYLDYVGHEWKRRKSELHVQDFDDFLETLHECLLKTPETLSNLRQQYRVAYVDEFQDTDHLQYAIFDLAFGQSPDHQLLMIGDPKQSIYGFRGADMPTYLKAKAQALAEGQVLTLNGNYRSNPELVQAINSIFALRGAMSFAHPNKENEVGIEFDAVQAKSAKGRFAWRANGQSRQPVFGVQWSKDEGKSSNKDDHLRASAKICADSIAKLLKASWAGVAGIERSDEHGETKLEPVQPGDVAILCSQHRDLQLCKEALAKWGIPAIAVKSGDLFHSDEARDIKDYLRAILEPNEARIRRFLLHTLRYNAAEMEAVDDGAMMEHLLHFLEDQRHWNRRGPSTVFEMMMERYEYKVRVLKRYGGERQLTNWQHLCELIIAAAAENGSIESILNWMEEQKAAQREENEQRLETDAEAVQLVTIHGSKGLEYPFVFCPSLWTYRFDHDKKPDFFMCSRKGDPLGLRQLHFCKDSDSYEHNMPLHHLDRLREHLRLIYVALTRAVYYCQVGGADDKNSSPSASMQWLWAPSSTPLGAKMQAGPDFQHQLQGWCQHQGHDFITQDDCDGHPKVLRRDRGEVPLREPAPLVIHQANRTVASFSALTKHDSGSVHLSAHGPEQEEAELGSIHDFPRGAQVGDCLHYILEHTYFGQPEQQEALVRSSLRRHRLDIDGAGVDVMEQRSALLLDQLNHVAQADLGGFCLGEIDHRLVLAEMEFTFSLGYATPKSLAKIFREHGSSALVREYAERIDRLGFKSVQGHLTGFIDFCFVHHDRAYIIDWKSNHLGPNAMAYEELGTVMASHHYILQYHLYALALHLHLSKNWPDDAYHYETHFAKVIYPFLRGVQKQTDRGLYMDRPSFAMIQALEALLIPSSADFAHNDVEVLR